MTFFIPKSKPTVELIHTDGEDRPYKIEFRGHGWHDIRSEMLEWCTENFGHRSSAYNNPRWIFINFDLRFRDEKDAMFFMMRWG